MIIRVYAECEQCHHRYLIRYNLGNKFPQSASFHCSVCGEFLEYGYEKQQNTILKNIKIIRECDGATVKNLHPELVIDAAFSDDPMYQPSLDFVYRSIENDGGSLGSLIKFRKDQMSAGLHLERWDAIATDYRYLREERWNLLEGKFGRDKPRVSKRILKEVINVGRLFLTGKWNDQYRAVLSEVEKAKKHVDFSNCSAYLKTYFNDFLLDKMFTVMQQYRKVESNFLPALLSSMQGIEPNGVSSAVNWDEIEMVYGNFYELFGDMLVIPTAINNLLVRNDYSLFNSNGFTLQDYIKTDKSGRCANFSLNSNLSFFEKFYDSNLRNGTHHKTAKIDKDKQLITIRSGRGGNTTVDYSFIQYSEYCNEIYAHCLILFNVYFKIVY